MRWFYFTSGLCPVCMGYQKQLQLSVIIRKPSLGSKSTCQSWQRGEMERTGIFDDIGDPLSQPSLESTLPSSLFLCDITNFIFVLASLD